MILKTVSTCYYFDDIMRVRDTDFRYILLDKKSYKIYDVSCKTFMGPKALRIRFYEIDGFIQTYGVY